MKKNYELSGMNCVGCVNAVKNALLQMSDISSVEVQLDPQSAVITMDKSIGINELQEQLAKSGPYIIKEIIQK